MNMMVFSKVISFIQKLIEQMCDRKFIVKFDHTHIGKCFEKLVYRPCTILYGVYRDCVPVA